MRLGLIVRGVTRGLERWEYRALKLGGRSNRQLPSSSIRCPIGERGRSTPNGIPMRSRPNGLATPLRSAKQRSGPCWVAM